MEATVLNLLPLSFRYLGVLLNEDVRAYAYVLVLRGRKKNGGRAVKEAAPLRGQLINVPAVVEARYGCGGAQVLEWENEGLGVTEFAVFSWVLLICPPE